MVARAPIAALLLFVASPAAATSMPRPCLVSRCLLCSAAKTELQEPKNRYSGCTGADFGLGSLCGKAYVKLECCPRSTVWRYGAAQKEFSQGVGKNSRMKARNKKGGSKKHSPVTLKMIAERVGLTKGTCSAVLNKSAASRSVPQHTQDRILEAARELNY